MLYKMVSGSLPFGGHDAHDFNTVLQLHLNQKQKSSAGNDSTLVREEEMMLEQEQMPEHYKVDTKLLQSACGNNEEGKNCINLITALLVFREPVRLGSKDGARECLTHPWFKDLDIEAMKLHALESPYKPDAGNVSAICRGDLDIFEQLAFEEDKDSAKLTPQQDEVFADFYYNPWHEDDDARSTMSDSSRKRTSSAQIGTEQIQPSQKEVLKERRKSRIDVGRSVNQAAMLAHKPSGKTVTTTPGGTELGALGEDNESVAVQ